MFACREGTNRKVKKVEEVFAVFQKFLLVFPSFPFSTYAALR
jgi:hypothetical protein